MGFPTIMFVHPPEEEIICSVCAGVFESPQSLPCGHTFCQECLHLEVVNAIQHHQDDENDNDNDNNDDHLGNDDKDNDNSTNDASGSRKRPRTCVGKCPTCNLSVYCGDDDNNNNNNNNNTAASGKTATADFCCGNPSGALDRLLLKLPVHCLHQAEHDQSACKNLPNGEQNNNNNNNNNNNSKVSNIDVMNQQRLDAFGDFLENDFMDPHSQHPSGAPAADLLCAWTGKLSEWKEHCRTECPLSIMRCEVKGCTWQGPRKDHLEHLSTNTAHHMDLVIQATTSSLEQTVAKLQSQTSSLMSTVQQLETSMGTLQAELNQSKRTSLDLYIHNFCRQWVRNKPDALYDFQLYREKQPTLSSSSFNQTNHGDKSSAETRSNKRLLIGIPGPTNSPWAGGLFPLLMEWSSLEEPPRCTFLKEFQSKHVHVENGNLLLDRKYFSLDVTIPEMLYLIQQRLFHPNDDDDEEEETASDTSTTATATTDGHKKDYSKNAKSLAAKYPSDDFESSVSTVFGMELSFSDFELVDERLGVGKRTRRQQQQQQQFPKPNPRPKVPKISSTKNNNKANHSCKCSCCAWGSTFWDKKREMRYLFGA